MSNLQVTHQQRKEAWDLFSKVFYEPLQKLNEGGLQYLRHAGNMPREEGLALYTENKVELNNFLREMAANLVKFNGEHLTRNEVEE